MLKGWLGPFEIGLVLALSVFAGGCVTTSEPVSSYRTQQEKPTGFFDRLMDKFSERECNVGRFTCSYGLGAAGEPCDCVGPDDVVFSGWTVK